MSLADVDLANPDTFVPGVPHDAFKRLRAEQPVFWQREENGNRGFWVVTTYEDILAVSKDPATFSSARGGTNIFELPEEELQTIRTMMVNMDPPQHTKYRRLVNQGFTPRMVAILEPHIRSICTRIVDQVAAAGTCDFVTQVAAELPLQVIAEMLGVPQEDRHKVFDWSNRLIGFDDPEYQTSFADGKVAAAEMWGYANQLARARRGKPRDDLISALLRAEVDGEALTEMEFDSFFLLIAVAGNETTRNLISGGMLALVEHPEERARLIAEPDAPPDRGRGDVALGDARHPFPAHRDARHGAARDANPRRRQDRPLLLLGQSRRARVPRGRPLRRRTHPERPSGLRVR